MNKRVNTRGIKQATKHVLMAALTYNLKKYLKFIARKPKSKAQEVTLEQEKWHACLKTIFLSFNWIVLSLLIFRNKNFISKPNLV